MIRNFLKIALRNLAGNKVSAFINIGGLAVGMAVALLVGLWVWDECSFNKYHSNYDRIAQVMKRANYDGEIVAGNYLPYPLTIELKTNYRQYFKHLLTARQQDQFGLASDDKKIVRTGQFIDDGAPEMLGLRMLQGNWSALKELHSIILSASTAKALFGNEDPIGKPVMVNNKMKVKITGVFEDLPRNTSFHGVQFFAPFDLDIAYNASIREQSWDNQFLLLYAELAAGKNYNEVSEAIRNAEIAITRRLDNYQKQARRKPVVLLNPMSNWHLYSNFENGIPANGPVQFVWLVGAIGCFVLLLACINFMNLSTARSETRAKEVGIRKAMGSKRIQLIAQFFSESFVVVLFAFLLANLLAAYSLAWFNNLAAKDISLPYSNGWFWIFSVIFILVTGLLAGGYPALYLSSFHPVSILKNTFRAGKLVALPRQVLVTLQFSISVILVICTMVVYKQLLFVKDRPVGYDREGLIMVEKKSADFDGKYELMRAELMKTGVVAEMAESGGKVTGVWQWNGGFVWEGKDPDFDPHFGTLAVTSGYGKAVGWQFTDGRDFYGDAMADSSAVVLTEAAANITGFKNPVGQFIKWETKWQKARNYKIIGVVKDMLMDSPFEPVVPTIFRIEKNLGWINIRFNPQVSTARAITEIETVFKNLVPSAPFDYKFADQEYSLKFAEEERIGKLAGLFAVLAIFISCLGVFGMASFVAEKRTREIGIRKVLGASVFGLWRMLSAGFLLLVIISCAIAIPVTHYFLQSWLDNYQYRTEMSWWIFAFAAAGAVVITLLTVSFQSIKAALMNPVESLRTE